MDRWIADTDPGVKFPAWTRGNAADVFPDPASPFFATTYLRTSLGKGLVDAYSTIGVFDWDEVENPVDPTMFGVFGGYIYNPLSYTRLFGARMPGASPEAIDKASRESLVVYRPSIYQLPVHRCQSPEMIIFGGKQAGKSVCAANEFASRVLGIPIMGPDGPIPPPASAAPSPRATPRPGPAPASRPGIRCPPATPPAPPTRPSPT